MSCYTNSIVHAPREIHTVKLPMPAMHLPRTPPPRLMSAPFGSYSPLPQVPLTNILAAASMGHIDPLQRDHTSNIVEQLRTFTPSSSLPLPSVRLGPGATPEPALHPTTSSPFSTSLHPLPNTNKNLWAKDKGSYFCKVCKGEFINSTHSGRCPVCREGGCNVALRWRCSRCGKDVRCNGRSAHSSLHNIAQSTSPKPSDPSSLTLPPPHPSLLSLAQTPLTEDSGDSDNDNMDVSRADIEQMGASRPLESDLSPPPDGLPSSQYVHKVPPTHPMFHMSPLNPFNPLPPGSLPSWMFANSNLQPSSTILPPTLLDPTPSSSAPKQGSPVQSTRAHPPIPSMAPLVNPFSTKTQRYKHSLSPIHSPMPLHRSSSPVEIPPKIPRVDDSSSLFSDPPPPAKAQVWVSEYSQQQQQQTAKARGSSPPSTFITVLKFEQYTPKPKKTNQLVDDVPSSHTSTAGVSSSRPEDPSTAKNSKRPRISQQEMKTAEVLAGLAGLLHS
eukprot:TRINITY_DN2846_c0_g1_i3.p1 TRINITY_DN2846_c0_g1~~TRINITY_DN2846_c0_g1_i3.p1  ORF type:complete len:499 (-),score=92.93 TRINITY_DN2846_c0_g1_i3:62-1558(-)